MSSVQAPGETMLPSPTAADDASKLPPERRSSFNFLRRQKSADSANNRKTLKKQKHMQVQQPAVPPIPPQLPTHAPLPQINSFGGENARPGRYYDPFSADGGSNNLNVNNSAGARISTSSYQPVARPMTNSSGLPPHGVPIPPIPNSLPVSRNGDFDPYATAESMTHRGRYSYASSAVSGGGINGPRRVRRRKDPTPFNILVVGAKNSGKTSFIEFLRSSLAVNGRKRERTPSPPQTAVSPDSPFTPHYLETEIDHERIGVTIWDSQGLDQKFVDLQLREMSSFLESKFEETFTEEMKVIRAPGVRDTHIHCVILILDPSRLDSNLNHARNESRSVSKFDSVRLQGILDEDLDVQVLKTLLGKSTVIPIISKADTITTAHMSMLKKSVWDSLKQAKLDPLEALNLAADELDEETLDERDEDMFHSQDMTDRDDSDIIDNLVDRSSGSDFVANGKASPIPQVVQPKTERFERSHKRSVSNLSAALNLSNGNNPEAPLLPMSIISPDRYDPGIIGRRFPWGFADPYNEEHCDFVRLKDCVFTEWRAELREASREVWYEGWRTSRLKRRERTTTSYSNKQRAPQYQPSPAVQLPNSGSPEMIRGHYNQGVNAF